eukprot:gene16445-7859_t
MILRLPCLTLADFAVIKSNFMLNGHVFMNLSGVDDVGCAVKCTENHRCRSYNILIASKICELSDRAFRDKFTNNLTETHGWIYKSTDYNKTKVGPTCERLRPCGDDVLCREKCEPPFYECVHCSSGYYGLHCDQHERFTGCVSQNSARTPEGYQLNYLVDDAIRCEGNSPFLKRFRFKRHNDNQWFNSYQYTCCEQAVNNITRTVANSTPKTTYSTHSKELTHLSIDCEGGFLIGMKLQLTESGTKIHYDYECAVVTNLLWKGQILCFMKYTPWQYNGNGNIIYLDRLEVNCDQEYVLQHVELRLMPEDSFQWRYEYRCCKINYL